jgi:quinoprotein glucose dehydrogenase
MLNHRARWPLKKKEPWMKVRSRSVIIYLCCALCIASIFYGENAKSQKDDWPDYGSGPDSMQYSALTQIDKSNVKHLTQAWFYPTPRAAGRFSFNPVIVDGTMYVLGDDGAIVALDAATGKAIWTHPTQGTPIDRGINYWQSADGHDRRLIFSADSFLQEIDARTGASITTFGTDGRVDLREGLGRDPKTIPQIQTGTPGHIFQNSIILGSATSESYGSPPGDIRAFDVLSGKSLWIFHTIPHPGPRMHGNMWAASTTGASFLSTRRVESDISRSVQQRMTIGAAIALVPICLAIAS